MQIKRASDGCDSSISGQGHQRLRETASRGRYKTPGFYLHKSVFIIKFHGQYKLHHEGGGQQFEPSPESKGSVAECRLLV